MVPTRFRAHRRLLLCLVGDCLSTLVGTFSRLKVRHASHQRGHARSTVGPGITAIAHRTAIAEIGRHIAAIRIESTTTISNDIGHRSSRRLRAPEADPLSFAVTFLLNGLSQCFALNLLGQYDSRF